MNTNAPHAELVLSNASLVLGDEIIQGSIVVRDGKIAEISSGTSKKGIDLEGDMIIPGMVELHTDHVETHFSPRPGVRWNADITVLAHDAQIASSGITTVFNAICIGMGPPRLPLNELQVLIRAIQNIGDAGHLRSEHFTHIRCEVPTGKVMDDIAALIDEPSVRLVSLMDHTPGQRQFPSIASHRAYHTKMADMKDADYDKLLEERLKNSTLYARKNRKAISELCEQRNLPKASHDDASAEHVAEAVGDNVSIAEFPTTLEAADASWRAGMKVLMGAPNIVRGGSHSGNISALELAENNCLDILSSDYIPMSLLQSVFVLAERLDTWSLPRAVRTVTANPANAVGLTDRGVLETGKRGDLVRLHMHGKTPVIKSVWRAGRRVI